MAKCALFWVAQNVIFMNFPQKETPDTNYARRTDIRIRIFCKTCKNVYPRNLKTGWGQALQPANKS